VTSKRRVADLVVNLGSELGEGPVWDSLTLSLIWVDIVGPTIHTYRPGDGQIDSRAVAEPIGALALRRSGGLVLAMASGFWLLDVGSSQPYPIALVEVADSATRMNDGKCDRAGRFWASSMRVDTRAGGGRLYRLDADHHPTLVLEDLTIPNGLAWSGDDGALYFVDSPIQSVDMFDYDPGTGMISKRRRLITIDPIVGEPDGMTIDAEGHLWVAMWGGGAVHRYSPAGRLELIVSVPTTNVTSCTFGGEDLRDLYITSARRGLSAAAQAAEPYAGGLFCYKSDVPGLPAEKYAG
jgi:sugar lactone lactonase YvrE